jgi:uncharacterized membrane protein YheB (UPF0754 family)
MTPDLSFLLPPLVGGIIGYITNDVAIRMLFRPHQPKYLFGHRIPFTPGIIPKEKNRIALAVGESISENLINREVLEKNLLSDEMLSKITTAIDKFVSRQRNNPETLEQYLRHYLTREELENIKSSVKTDLGKILYKKLNDASVGTKISHKVIESVMKKMQGGFKGMVNQTLGISQVLELMAEPAEHLLAKQVNELISSNSEQMVGTLLEGETQKLLSLPMNQLMANREQQIEQLKDTTLSLYRNIITERLPRILKALDISRIIESRINEMDMNDTERIIHQVVDHELKAVIWFGALLGFIIGIVNVLF